ncbi:hypothetical protein ACHWQZ_G010731 [Mnemiopsis leidyi]
MIGCSLLSISCLLSRQRLSASVSCLPYLSASQQSIDGRCSSRWFHGRISDAMVDDMLRHEDDGRYVMTHSASNSYCMHIKTGSDIKSTPIYPTVDGKYMMGSQSHESLTHCIDSKGKSYPNLSPVKRKNIRNAINYGTNTPNQPLVRDDEIPARWRPSSAKEWKPINIFFETDQENAVFKSTDKKGEKVEKLIPLRYCRVYEVDESMFSSPYCLQIVVTGLNREVQGHFIEVDSHHKYMELLAKLQNEPKPVDNGPSRPGKRMKNLRIKVCQIDSPAPVSFSGPVFCQVGFDDSTVQRTPNAHNAKKLCWNSTLNCKHSNINKSSELKVKLCYSKNKKTCELNAATVPLSNLQNMTFQTRYETLNIKGQNNQAKLKLELYYRDHAVLQPSYYHDLVNHLQKDNFRAIKLLRHLRWRESRETFAHVLLTVYDNNKVHLIKEILSEEIARHPENDRGSLFRDNTITTALMTAMLNAPPCGTYWDSVFTRIVADMNARVKDRSETSNLDDDGRRSQIEDDRNAVLETLKRSVSEIPDAIKDIIRHVLSEVAKKWPNEPTIQSATLLTIMFVRFFSLRLSHPKDSDLLAMHSDTAQALLSVAKSIKRKDVKGFLDAVLNSAPSSNLNVDTLQDVSTLEAGDGAHLFHLIQSTLHATDSTSPWIPELDSDRESMDSLKRILKHLESVERDVD